MVQISITIKNKVLTKGRKPYRICPLATCLLPSMTPSFTHFSSVTLESLKSTHSLGFPDSRAFALAISSAQKCFFSSCLHVLPLQLLTQMLLSLTTWNSSPTLLWLPIYLSHLIFTPITYQHLTYNVFYFSAFKLFIFLL